MENIEKIQKAMELMKEVKKDTPDDTILQMFMDESISRMENIKVWLKKK